MELEAALIQAAGAVLAALVGVSGVAVILRHRRTIQDLADNVAAYWHLEAALIRELERRDNPGVEEPSETRLRALRRQWRDRLCQGETPRPTLSATQARRLAKRLI